MTLSNSSKNNNLINYTSEQWEDLKSTHYSLIDQSIKAINSLFMTNFPLNTTTLINENENENEIINLNKYEKFLLKYIDIFLLIKSFKSVKNDIKKDVLLKKIFFIIIYAFFIFPLWVLISLKFFQSKRLVIVLLEIYIKSLIDSLVITYTRLNCTNNLNIKEHKKYKFWVRETIDDCKNFSITFNSIASYKFIFPLVSGLTAFLPVIIKNTFLNNIIKKTIENIPHLNHIIIQLLVLFFLYLPTFIILLIFINSYVIMVDTLYKFDILDYEEILNEKLQITEKKAKMRANLMLYMSYQIFFLLTATLFLIPHLLVFSLYIKIPLILIAVALWVISMIGSTVD